jgi:hypothetical protein
MYKGVSKSFRTGHLERELQMVQLSATRCNCIIILWVSTVSFTAITLCFASQRVFIVVSIYFVIDLVRKRFDTHSYFFPVILNFLHEYLKTCLSRKERPKKAWRVVFSFGWRILTITLLHDSMIPRFFTFHFLLPFCVVNCESTSNSCWWRQSLN